MRVLSLVLAGVLLLSNSLYAVDAPFIVASLPNSDLPQNRVKAEDDSGTMITASLADTPDTTSDLTDADITWSWEEELEPLDILDYVQNLPYDEWIEIDEVTTRRLFEDLIQISINQMDLEEGGHFEDMLRERFFYFTPEREYYFPPYEEDLSQRETLFPVKIMRVQSSKYDICKIALGRFLDDERDMKITFKNDQLKIIELDREQYYPGETGPKKSIKNLIGFYDDQTIVLEMWFNDDVSTFIESQRLFEYEIGNSNPIIDNAEGELALDLSGIELLFDLPDFPRIYDRKVFQTYSSLINICKLQLNIADDGYELEKLLWQDLFYYYIGANYFGGGSEYFNARRTYHDIDYSSQARFEFDGGNVANDRGVVIILSQDFGDIDRGYEWGIDKIELTRRHVLLSDNTFGEEKRIISFNEGPSGIEMSYWVFRYNASEEQVYNEQRACFKENNSQNLILVGN